MALNFTDTQLIGRTYYCHEEKTKLLSHRKYKEQLYLSTIFLFLVKRFRFTHVLTIFLSLLDVAWINILLSIHNFLFSA